MLRSSALGGVLDASSPLSRQSRFLSDIFLGIQSVATSKCRLREVIEGILPGPAALVTLAWDALQVFI